MHEMGIALEIMDIAIASVPVGLEKSRIKKINVRLGKLSSVNSENLRFCFDVISKDNFLSEVDLSLEIIPVVIKCQDCGDMSTINKPTFICEKCKSDCLKILSGKELEIRSIEIEEKE